MKEILFFKEGNVEYPSFFRMYLFANGWKE